MCEINESSKLDTYAIFKVSFGKEKYLSCITNFTYRQCLSRIRLAAHDLQVELGRRNNTPRQDRICLLCNRGVENEQHFLLECETLTHIREQYLPTFFLNNSNHHSLCKLMQIEHKNHLLNLCKFIYFACKYRDTRTATRKSVSPQSPQHKFRCIFLPLQYIASC